MESLQGVTEISWQILDLLKKNPSGLNIMEIRNRLSLSADKPHQHLDRRLRALDPYFIIERKKDGVMTKYVFKGKRPKGEWRYAVIDKTLRAKILMKAGSRCQMCGRTIAQDQVELDIDHKIPQSWGGLTVEENLWALCSPCNEGKKNYFASFDADVMKKVLGHKEVHRRLAGLLLSKANDWIDTDLLEFVANYNDFQEDWQKRLRELRDLGLSIDTRRQKRGRRTVSQYKLTKWKELPNLPLRPLIRLAELKRKTKSN